MRVLIVGGGAAAARPRRIYRRHPINRKYQRWAGNFGEKPLTDTGNAVYTQCAACKAA